MATSTLDESRVNGEPPRGGSAALSSAPGSGSSSGSGEPEDAAERSPLSDAQSAVLIEAVDRASRVGLVMRTALFAVAILAAFLAVVYTTVRGDQMVDTIMGRNPENVELWESVASLTLPVLMFVLLGAVCVAGAYVLQSRALDERERALDAIARIRREAEAGVSRARTLARLTEDDLTHARREFAMQVSFGRASWWLAIVLIAVSVTYSIAKGDLDAYSLAFSGGGVLSYLVGVLFKVPSRVRCNLSALSQRHLIISGYAREIGLIEADAYRLITASRRRQEPSPDCSAGVSAAAREIRAATDAAVTRIEQHCKLEAEVRARR